MEKYDGSFEKEHEDRLRIYIKEPWFKELNDIVGLCNLSDSEESILQSIKDYISTNIKEPSYLYVNPSNKENCAIIDKNNFNEATRRFIKFMESYKKRDKPKFGEKDELLDSLLKITASFQKRAKGFYFYGLYLGTDHSIYLAKKSMLQRGLEASRINRSEVNYNPIMAQHTFEYFGVPVAEYFLGYTKIYPYRLIITKSFLR